MKTKIHFTSYLIVGIMLMWSCKKPEMVSDIPDVELKSVLLSNSTDTLGNEIKKVLLTFSLIDGDGDIGLPENGYPGFDTLDNKNLFITLYQKKDGIFTEVSLLAPHYYRTPFQETEGQDKTLKADYEVTMEYAIAFFTYDTIKYSLYVYDRKLHQSNVVETPQIPADTLGLIEYN